MEDGAEDAAQVIEILPEFYSTKSYSGIEILPEFYTTKSYSGQMLVKTFRAQQQNTREATENGERVALSCEERPNHRAAARQRHVRTPFAIRAAT